MEKSIDFAIGNGWHVTIFLPAFGLLIVAAVGFAVVATKAWRARS